MLVFQEAIGLTICQITKSENAHGCSSFEIIFIYMFATSAKLIKKKTVYAYNLFLWSNNKICKNLHESKKKHNDCLMMANYK